MDRVSIGTRLVGGWARWAAGVRTAASLTFSRPALWPISLVGFLARGGIALFLLAVVTPPSPVGLANLVGPTAITPTGLNPTVVGPLIAIVIGSAAGVLIATAAGAWADATGILAVHDDQPRPVSGRLVGSLVGVRIVVAVPLLVVAALVVRSIVEVTYDQLVLPSDLSVPLAWRVARDAAGPAALIVVTWQLSEVVGGIATRRVVLFREPSAVAIGTAVRHLVRHPLTAIATTILGIVGLAIAIVPALVALGLSGGAVTAQLAHGSVPGAIGIVAVIFVAVWLGGLVLAAVGAAWRSALWTVEVGRLPH